MLALKRKREAQARAAAAAAAASGCSTNKTLQVPVVPLVRPPPHDAAGGSGVALSVKKKRTAAEIRIQKDLELVETEDANIVFPDPNDLTEFKLEVSPKKGPWSGGVFDFAFQVLPNYPYSPPRVICETKIYHPNVSFFDGKVCLGMREWWRPVHDVSTVIHGLVNMFYEPAVDISVNQQAASLLQENEEQFNRVVQWTRRRTNDKKTFQQAAGHSILDILPPELLRITTEYLDEESLLKFFISALGSVPHQYIYTTMARKLVRQRFANLQRLMRNYRRNRPLEHAVVAAPAARGRAGGRVQRAIAADLGVGAAADDDDADVVVAAAAAAADVPDRGAALAGPDRAAAFAAPARGAAFALPERGFAGLDWGDAFAVPDHNAAFAAPDVGVAFAVPNRGAAFAAPDPVGAAFAAPDPVGVALAVPNRGAAFAAADRVGAAFAGPDHGFAFAAARERAAAAAENRAAAAAALNRAAAAAAADRDRVTTQQPMIPPAVIWFVDEYASHMEAEDEANHVAGVLSVSGGNSAALKDESSAGELEAIMDLQRIVQVIHSLSGRLAVLHYFRDTIQKATKQDILWPVWCGKFELQTGGNRGHVTPSTVISTPIWYPSLIRRCKRAFSNEYCARTMLHGFDLMRRFERGFSFLLAQVSGMSSKDVRELSEIDGRRLNRSGGESTDAFYRMAVVRPERARELLHRLTTFRAGILDLDDHPFGRHNRMPLAQYERVVEQGGNGQLYCLWEDSLDGDGADAVITCQEFTDLTVELLTTQKSLALLGSLPEYWHAGEWKEPPTMMWRRT